MRPARAPAPPRPDIMMAYTLPEPFLNFRRPMVQIETAVKNAADWWGK